MSTRRQERRRDRFRPRLLGGAPLGMGQGGGVGQPVGAAGTWLINDDFTTPLTAGNVNDTAAEPGPGRRDLVDTSSKISISGDAAVFATGGAVGDPRLLYQFRERRPGLLVYWDVTYAAGGMDLGWDNDTISGVYDGFRVSGTNIGARTAGSVINVGTVATATRYEFVAVLRASGVLLFIKGGSYTNWTLMWVSEVGGGSAAPIMQAINSSSSASAHRVGVPRARWMPAPVISSGFGGTFGTSDGLGHAEGTVGGLGAGGSGVTWTQQVNTWANSGGLAASTTAGAAIATAPAGEVDVIVTVKCYLSSGTMGIIVRWTDVNNYVLLRVTPTNRQLVKVVSGSPATVTDVGYTYVAGEPLRLLVRGTTFRIYYNDVLSGSASYTISDVALQSGTVVGLQSDNTGNQFDDFVVWARGSDGEYDTALDAI